MTRVDSPRNKRGRARERRSARQRRREAMAVRLDSTAVEHHPEPSTHSRKGRTIPRQIRSGIGHAALTSARDGLWYLKNNPIYLWGGLALILLIVLMYFFSFSMRGRIMPGVSAAGVSLSGLTAQDAQNRLYTAWNGDVQIRLRIQGETVTDVSPNTLGIRLDAEATIDAARDTGLGAIPFGRDLAPVVSLDHNAVQHHLLDLAREVDVRPKNASYQLVNDEVVGVEGQNGRMLDTALTIDYLLNNLDEVVMRRSLELVMVELLPDERDPSMYLEQVRQLVEGSFELRGYDPFINRYYTWPVEPDIYLSWLEVGPLSLDLRNDVVGAFVNALTASLNQEGEDIRYISVEETRDAVREAVAENHSLVELRVRYRQTTYQVRPGDRGHSIAREKGIPFYLIDEVNSGLDWGRLSVGTEIVLPSRDVVLPEEIIENKRIVVDLNRNYLMAFENNQVVFEWPISPGMPRAPTSPGIFQILNKSEVAYGSSNELCDVAGVVCGRWEMNWFMGIYRVSPGLVNGFHGDVLLPNGNRLGDGMIGYPATFGCVMSPDEQAKQLYDWADVGTVVEIISGEFPPQSDLAELVVSNV